MKLAFIFILFILRHSARSEESLPIKNFNSEEEMKVYLEKKRHEAEERSRNTDLTEINQTLKVINKLPSRAFIAGLNRSSLETVTQGNYYTSRELIELYRDNDLKPDSERGKGML